MLHLIHTCFRAATIGLVLTAAGQVVGLVPASAAERAPRVRSFLLDYGATLTALSAGAQVRVWLPVPPSNDHQEVRQLPADFPAAPRIAVESTYGNSILYFEAPSPASGELSFHARFQVTRREVQGLRPPQQDIALSVANRKLFLSAQQRVPLGGKPATLLQNMRLPADPLELARVLYDRVDQHVRYDKSQPGYGNGDVLWVCDSGFGNCTDFHSLFISLARAHALPARFEIGFPLPAARGKGVIAGYHCWATFFVDGHGWVPVDISEADKHPELKDYYFGNLTENRVSFSIGRDITLVPKQAACPLNYFVDPHVEVDGKPLDREQIDLKVSYVDDSH